MKRFFIFLLIPCFGYSLYLTVSGGFSGSVSCRERYATSGYWWETRGWFHNNSYNYNPATRTYSKHTYGNPQLYAFVLNSDDKEYWFIGSPDEYRFHFRSGSNDEKNRVCESTKDPINTRTGNNYFTESRLHVPCPGIPLVFDLKYQSISPLPESGLGKGWRHSYSWVLESDDTRAVLFTGSGEKYLFHRSSGGTYLPPATVNWNLLANEAGHEVHQPGGVVYQFSADGSLRAIHDAWNNRVDCFYDFGGCLESVEHSNGQKIVFSNHWESSVNEWRISSVHVPNGPSLIFSYNGEGQIAQIQEQAGGSSVTSQYTYVDGFLTEKTGRAGHLYLYDYETGPGALLNGKGTFLSADGRYEHTVHYISSNTTDVIYSARGEEQMFRYSRNPDGTLSVLYGPAVSGPELEQSGTVFVYAPNGVDKIEETRFDSRTGASWSEWMQYDDRHHITGYASAYRSTEPVHRYLVEYDPVWNLPSAVTDAEGNRREMSYTNGVIAISRIYLSDNETAETVYSYTTNGLLSAITNANGQAVSFTYDAAGYPASIIPAAGPAVTLGHNARGHLTDCTLPGGRETVFTVNPLGRTERIDYADGLYETFQYDGLGNLTRLTDRAGRTSEYTYAPDGKLVTASREFDSTNVTVTYEYDQQMNALAVRDELGRSVERYELDIEDRPIAVTSLEGQTMSISYQVGDFIGSITRFDGTSVSNEYDAGGYLSAVYYPDETNRYTFLISGPVRTSENSSGMISNVWNSAGWLTEAGSQVSGAGNADSAVFYAYNSVGSVTNTEVFFSGPSPDSLTTFYSYDEAERLTSISTSSADVTFEYSYHPDNGLISSVSNAYLRAEYSYDILDRITRINWTESSGADILAFDYGYNAAGMITNVVKEGRSDLSVSRYEYDDLDRLTSEVRITGNGEQAAGYSYDAAGSRLGKTGSDYTVEYTPGTGNRLASWNASSSDDFERFRTLEVRGCSSKPIGADSRWGYLWVSNSVAVVTPEISGSEFWIDAFAVGTGTQTVAAAIRDQAGNTGYAASEFLMTVITNGVYHYSAAGCVTNISYSGTEYAGAKDLAWDSQYRLTSVLSAASAVEYSYDVTGRRISRAAAGSGDPGSANVEYFVYNGNQVVADLDENGNILRTYLWGPGIDNLLALTVHPSEGSGDPFAVLFPLKDHFNTVHALVDTSGRMIERYEYDAWGRTAVFDGDGNKMEESAVGNRYCFQGREIDWTTKLYYFRTRWYDPVTGRWLSKDPIGITGGLNQYVFCGNNPVNKIDPTGEFGISGAAWGAFTGAVSGFSTGMAASGGDWLAALNSAGAGAIVGMAVGTIMPPGMEGAAGGAVGGALGSIIGQSMSGAGSINWGSVVGGALGGAAAGSLGNITSAGLVNPAAVQVARGLGQIIGSATSGVLELTGGHIADRITLGLECK